MVTGDNGYLGVGSSTPQAVLSVSNVAQSTTDLFRVASTTNALYFQVASTGQVKMASNKWFSTLDNAGTGDLNIFKASTSDQVILGANLKTTSINDGLVGHWSLEEEDETHGDKLSYSFINGMV